MGSNINLLRLSIASVGMFLFAIGLTNAQDNGLSGTIVVPGDIKPKLADAVKIDVVPVQENITVKKPAMTYTTDPYLVPSPTYKTKLQAFALKNVPLPELQ